MHCSKWWTPTNFLLTKKVLEIHTDLCFTYTLFIFMVLISSLLCLAKSSKVWGHHYYSLTQLVSQIFRCRHRWSWVKNHLMRDRKIKKKDANKNSQLKWGSNLGRLRGKWVFYLRAAHLLGNAVKITSCACKSGEINLHTLQTNASRIHASQCNM